MKHLLLFTGLTCCLTAALAQRPTDSNVAQSPTAVDRAEAQSSLDQGVEALMTQRGGGTILFQETFSNGFDGSNGNGAWSVDQNVETDIWVWVAPGNTGYYADGTATGVSHPAGYYSTNIGALESTTASDGWMIFDNDYFQGGQINSDNPAVDTEGSLTSPVMDFSSNASIIVNWESYFRYCCAQASPIFLEVGTIEEGVTSWTLFDGHGNFIESANSLSANPFPVGVDVSCVAANQDSVQLRFAYRQAGGHSHYYWGIDDVTVSSNDVTDDIEITQIVNGDVFNVFEYRVTPIEQAIVPGEGGLLAGVMYRNVGTADQYGVEVMVEVLDPAGNVVNTTTQVLDTVYTFANAPTCPANSQDTLYVATDWEPDAIGTYGLRITMTADSADATPDNNVVVKDILYTDDIYGHDDDESFTGELGARESDDIEDYFDPTGYGSYYHCPNPGSMAYGLAIKFGPSCGLNLQENPEELEFETRLYELDGAVGLTASPFDANYWIYDQDWSNMNFDGDVEVYLSFDDPIELAVETFYFAAVINEYESPSQLTVLGQGNSDSDNSTGNLDLNSEGNYTWFVRNTYSPAIRLITSEREAVDLLEASQGIRLDQNIPNPAMGTTTIRFELGQSRDVMLEVRDGMGRLVSSKDMGTLGAGLHNMELNLDGWASGLYTYTLSADGLRTTKKMTIK